jgi:hypothetical protein
MIYNLLKNKPKIASSKSEHLTSNQVVGGSNPSGRAKQLNKLAVKLFLSLCYSVLFVCSKVFDSLWMRTIASRRTLELRASAVWQVSKPPDATDSCAAS